MMPTRWPNYSLFIFAALFGLILPLVLSMIWSWIRKDSRANESDEQMKTPLSAPPVGEAEPIAIRFHLAALLFLAFFGLTLLMTPLLFAIRSEQMFAAAISVGVIAALFVVVLFYCIRKGDLSWGVRRSSEDRGEIE